MRVLHVKPVKRCLKMAESIDKSIELQLMLPDKVEGTDVASISAPVSCEQASESIIVQIEQVEVEEGNSCCWR